MIDYSKVDLEAILARVYSQMTELQRPGVGRARANRRVMFDVWMGVGKTLMALASGFCFKPQRWLVVGTKNSFLAWQADFEKYFPELYSEDLITIVKGAPHEREWEYTHSDSLFYFTTAGALLRDIKWMAERKIRFDVISCDEIDRLGLRNRKSEFFKTIKTLIGAVEKHHDLKLVNFMTGTWSSKGPQQKWAALHLLAPKQFRGFWPFVSRYHHIHTNGWGREIGLPKNTQELALITMPYVYTVTEEEAAAHLPPLKRIPLYTQFTNKHMEEMYWSLANDLWMELNSGELLSVGNQIAATVRLRQFINCPQTIDSSLGVGPMIEAVTDKILDSEGTRNWKHNIIFTPFIAAIEPFCQYVGDVLKIPDSKIIRMQGGITLDELKAREHLFRNDPDTTIISSLRYSQSWNAETAQNVYFTGFEWDPDLNKQAEARSRRTSGDKSHTVMSYYCMIKYTITRDMMDIVNVKSNITHITQSDIMKVKANLRRPRAP